MKKLLALLLILTLAAGLFPLTAAAAGNDLDECELRFDGEPWKVYVIENLTDSITVDDLNITLVDSDGETVPEDKYELIIGTCVWDEENDQDVFTPADGPYSLTVDGEFLQEGFGDYAAYAAAKDGSGYTGETMLCHFMIWHRYSFNWFGANADFGGQYEKQSTWSWHNYYEIPANRISEPVIHGIDYSDPAPGNYVITYFERVTGVPVSDGYEYQQTVYPEDDPLAGLPVEEGSYFARIDGVAPYYGTSYVDFDIVAPIITGDVDLDGRITVSDVTAIQRHIAEIELFTDRQLAAADTNGDGKVDIDDATHLQKYLAEFDGIVLG